MKPLDPLPNLVKPIPKVITSEERISLPIFRKATGVSFIGLIVMFSCFTQLVDAETCPITLSGTALCELNPSSSSTSYCSYVCGAGESFMTTPSLGNHPLFHVDDIDGKLVSSCTKDLQTKYRESREDIRYYRGHVEEIGGRFKDAKGALEEAQKNFEVAQHRLRAAEREFSSYKNDFERIQTLLEKTEKKATSVKEEFSRFLLPHDKCPDPAGKEKSLPLPGSASLSCKDTRLSEFSGECSYLTYCFKLDGGKQLNRISVYQGSPDCRVDGTTTQHQENCNGVLVPRRSGESDTQCKNPEDAKSHAKRYEDRKEL
ncbi:MAG: hypothetical protein B7Y25_02835 [Alphaproteobacteria bacterium 16-39-46]|nr:MAG: hypothetical protein B7Y25_02835 [Alphaproteobacteria bacterium 16-39-46]OZA43533.1 MAG: hypothetical protein B7X84_03005 [Alphaproteobacteria bacterium 17-39-52]